MNDKIKDSQGRYTIKNYDGMEVNDIWIIAHRVETDKKVSRYEAKCKYCGNVVVRTLYNLQHSVCKCKHYNLPQSRLGTTIKCYEVIDVIKEPNKEAVYVCKCKTCGVVKQYIWGDLLELKSDKCFHVNKYGLQRQDMYKWKSRRLGCIFRGMVRRCYDEKLAGVNWKSYGGKGIKVCDEWMNDPMKFQDWAYQNGYNDELSIDRIDSDRDYCPDNCRWIPIEENIRLAASKYITVNGTTLNLTDWSKHLGLYEQKIGYLYNRYGEEYTIQYIHEMLQSGTSKLDNHTKVYISVDGVEHTQSEWNRILNLGKDTVGAYYRSHTLEQTQEYIRKKLNAIKGNS